MFACDGTADKPVWGGTIVMLGWGGTAVILD